MKLGILLWTAIACVPLPARAALAAEVERFAVIIGHNTGAREQAELRYAEDDAAKVQAVLGDLGTYLPENVVLLRGADASTVRRALIDVNDRLRARGGLPGVETSLLVYYSGHADGTALQLGDTRLPMVELEKLVRGSSAGFRLLIVDACRSGALTRVKGGRSAAPMAIELVERSPNEGVVFLTAASANEDAQESDELKGSFFTHYLVSGLLGAADSNGDGQVVLDEAYRYAYDHTLRASSRTLAGTQHPTFRYELKGRGHLVLTDLRRAQKRASLRFPPGRAYLVFHQDRQGSVVGEIDAGDQVRQLHLRPGRYFVRGRGSSFLLEGELTLASGERRLVDDARLERIEYARLVRKGNGDRTTQGPQLGYRLRTPIAGGAGPCQGGFAGWALDSAAGELRRPPGRLPGAPGKPPIRETADELDLELRGTLAWDLPLVTLELGLAAGGALFRQTFATAGVAPERRAGGAHIGPLAGVQVDLARGIYLIGDLAAQTYFLRQRSSSSPRGGGAAAEPGTSLISAFVVRCALGIGQRW